MGSKSSQLENEVSATEFERSSCGRELYTATARVPRSGASVAVLHTKQEFTALLVGSRKNGNKLVLFLKNSKDETTARRNPTPTS